MKSDAFRLATFSVAIIQAPCEPEPSGSKRRMCVSCVSVSKMKRSCASAALPVEFRAKFESSTLCRLPNAERAKIR